MFLKKNDTKKGVDIIYNKVNYLFHTSTQRVSMGIQGHAGVLLCKTLQQPREDA